MKTITNSEKMMHSQHILILSPFLRQVGVTLPHECNARSNF